MKRFETILIVALLFVGCSDNNTERLESNHLSLIECESYIESKVDKVNWNDYKSNQGYLFGKIASTDLTARCDKFGNNHWHSTYYVKK